LEEVEGLRYCNGQLNFYTHWRCPAHVRKQALKTKMSQAYKQNRPLNALETLTMFVSPQFLNVLSELQQLRLETDLWPKRLVKTDQLTTFVVKGGVCQEL
jgi:hypothetical protein